MQLPEGVLSRGVAHRGLGPQVELPQGGGLPFRRRCVAHAQEGRVDLRLRSNAPAHDVRYHRCRSAAPQSAAGVKVAGAYAQRGALQVDVVLSAAAAGDPSDQAVLGRAGSVVAVAAGGGGLLSAVPLHVTAYPFLGLSAGVKAHGPRRAENAHQALAQIHGWSIVNSFICHPLSLLTCRGEPQPHSGAGACSSRIFP